MKDVELLIESAYSDLEPSPALEETVCASLPAERARPIRRRRIALLAVAALGLALAALARPRAQEGLADEGPELPVVARPPTGVALELGEERVRVRLTRDGRILVPAEKEEWRQVSLADLGDHLARAAAAFDEREIAAGRSGYERGASLLRVDLVADRDAPWRHLQWVMIVCAEQKIWRLTFAARGAGGEYALDAALPVARGPEEPHVIVRVHVRTGDRTRYAFGDEESEELASVARYLAAAKDRAGDVAVRGEVRAGASAPFHEIAKVLAEFRQAGYDAVDFYGAKPPDDDARGAAKLPPPETGGAGAGGAMPGEMPGAVPAPEEEAPEEGR